MGFSSQCACNKATGPIAWIRKNLWGQSVSQLSDIGECLQAGGYEHRN